MNKKIRQGVFETNSSSTHSICIAKDVQPELPKSLHFEFGEFGWEVDTLDSVHQKASYLYTGLHDNERKEDIEKMMTTLRAKGIEVTKEDALYAEGEKWARNGGYVDHSNELNGFLDAVLADEKALINFLFSPLSFILTGNDNDDIDVDIAVDYPHDEYYKGN
jgi:hypothetical protein